MQKYNHHPFGLLYNFSDVLYDLQIVLFSLAVDFFKLRQCQPCFLFKLSRQM